MKTAYMQQIDVLMGGPGREATISRMSAETVAAQLHQMGHDVRQIDVAEQLDQRLLRPNSVVFDLIHGTYGEDGSLQRELEAVERTFVGSDSAASALCFDKQATKTALAVAGLPVCPGIVLAAEDDPTALSLEFSGPHGFAIKPVRDGSSVGLRLITSPAELPTAVGSIREELGPVDLLIEPRLTGAEYTVTVIEGGGGSLQALTPIRIDAHAGSYDYAAKYDRDDTCYIFAEEEPLASRLRELAQRSFTACGCRDLARVDCMTDLSGEPHVLEINTIPGFTSHSLVPKAAEHDGLGLAFLLEHLVLRAVDRRVCRCHHHEREGGGHP
ncbi:MAG: D-alanine--D-alanine ligase family protein [Planctomycetota bacterium]